MSESNPQETELRRRVVLTRLIAEGGMGRVIDGFAPDLDQYVAVKILRADQAEDPEVRQRFENEANLLGRMDHPGCPPIYGHGEDENGLPCYAMKKIEGRTLADLLAQRGDATRNVPWRKRLLAILLDATETIAHAHELGVIHRDLKPENILIDRSQSVYVVDWGLAKQTGADGDSADAKRTIAGKVMGTPGYMAPEQADGHASEAGPQADVFALGSILYEILTGRRPFGGAGGREEMLAAIHRDPKPPTSRNWRIPRSISTICMKALSKTPKQRYADARGLASDLRAFQEGRLSMLERAREAAREHPLRAIMSALLGFMLLFLVGNMVAQFWTDQRLANRAEKQIAVFDAELAKLGTETAAIRKQMDDPKTSVAKKAELKLALQEMDARWVLTEFEAQRLLTSVAELRFVRVESEIQPLARKRLFQLIHSMIQRNQPAMAAGLVENVLLRHQEGKSALKLSEEDIAQLKQLAREADRRFVVPRQ